MAEIQSTPQNGKKSGARCKKLSTRVDLTPMVDLGFLLITFFIFTTTLARAKAMTMRLPDEKATDHPMSAAEGKTLQLVLNEHDITCFYGNDSLHSFTTNYSGGIRNIIVAKMQQVAARFGDATETFVIIKPTDQATYQQMISILDEMRINGVKRYTIL